MSYFHMVKDISIPTYSGSQFAPIGHLIFASNLPYMDTQAKTCPFQPSIATHGKNTTRKKLLIILVPRCMVCRFFQICKQNLWLTTQMIWL